MNHSQFTNSAIFCLAEFEERLHFRGRLAAYGLNFKLQCTAVARECKAMDNSPLSGLESLKFQLPTCAVI
jgi:hypothetical protein